MTDITLVFDGKKIPSTPPNKQQKDDFSQYDNNSITEVNESTELGESLRELNKDTIGDNNQSAIDLRCRLRDFEISSILTLDALVGFRFLAPGCLSFTRQKKRLSVSEKGKGREEIRDMVCGKRDNDLKASEGIGGKLKKMFTGSNKQNL